MTTHLDIKRELIRRIETGALQQGDRVPSEYELVEQFGVSRNKARLALQELAIQGYLVRAQGKGSFVAPGVGDGNGNVQIAPTGDTETLALIFPEYRSRYAKDVVEGFMDAVMERGWHAVAYYSRHGKKAEGDMLRRIPQSGVAGAACWVLWDSEWSRKAIKELVDRRFPFVCMDRGLDGLDVDEVSTENVELGRRLTKALIGRGHERIAFMGTLDVVSSSNHRYAGYRQALEDAGLDVDEQLYVPFDDPNESRELQVCRMMARRGAPTAFLCVHDEVAVNLCKEIANLGYCIPDDVEIAAVDDDRFAKDMGLPMITAAQDGLGIGRKAAEVLLRRLADPATPPVRERVPARPMAAGAGKRKVGAVKKRKEVAPASME